MGHTPFTYNDFMTVKLTSTSITLSEKDDIVYKRIEKKVVHFMLQLSGMGF